MFSSKTQVSQTKEAYVSLMSLTHPWRHRQTRMHFIATIKKDTLMGKLVEGLDNRSKIVSVKWIIITIVILIEQTLRRS